MKDRSIQGYARAAGALLLISMVAGGFGEAYVPLTLFVADDPMATAVNLQNNEWLFRAGFASYLVEAVCDVALSLILYLLLKPVNRDIAMLSAFFGLVSTAIFASSQLFSFAALNFVVGGPHLDSFSQSQLNTLMLLSIEYSGLGAGVFMVFYGVASVLRGWLIVRSGFLPGVLGVFLFIAGLSFILRSFLVVLIPQYASNLFLLPMFVAVAALTAWLLIRGVNVDRWEAWGSPDKGS